MIVRFFVEHAYCFKLRIHVLNNDCHYSTRSASVKNTFKALDISIHAVLADKSRTSSSCAALHAEALDHPSIHADSVRKLVDINPLSNSMRLDNVAGTENDKF